MFEFLNPLKTSKAEHFTVLLNFVLTITIYHEQRTCMLISYIRLVPVVSICIYFIVDVLKLFDKSSTDDKETLDAATVATFAV